MAALVNLQLSFCKLHICCKLRNSRPGTLHIANCIWNIGQPKIHIPHCILHFGRVRCHYTNLHLRSKRSFNTYIYFAPVPSAHSSLLPHALAKDILSNVIHNSSVLTNRSSKWLNVFVLATKFQQSLS